MDGIDALTDGFWQHSQSELQAPSVHFTYLPAAFLEARFEENFQKKNHPNHYIFTDSDVAIVDDLGDVFKRYPEFHMALTFRNNKDQPLNSGFIAVRGTLEGLTKAKIFLQKVLEVYSSKYMKASRMLGDQLALVWVVKSHPSFDTKRFTRREAFLEEIHEASVLFLPCAIYNWTPPEGAGQFHGMPLDVKVDGFLLYHCHLSVGSFFRITVTLFYS
ncbi:hypothetical protein ACLOJK_022505 [Asimina triloba]